MKSTHKSNKGFTLAELLIVVAIIAVLVAIAVPTFGVQLEKARQMVDISNLRGAYVIARVTEMDGVVNGESIADKTYYYNPEDGTLDTIESNVTKIGKVKSTTVIADTDNLPSVASPYYTGTLSEATSGKSIEVKFTEARALAYIKFAGVSSSSGSNELDNTSLLNWTSEQAAAIYTWTESNGEITITGLSDTYKNALNYRLPQEGDNNYEEYIAEKQREKEMFGEYYDEEEVDGQLIHQFGIANNPITIMPDSIDSKPITSIAEKAFQNVDGNLRGCLALQISRLPKNLTSIGDLALYSCKNLALTYLPDSLTSIGDSALYYCLNLSLTSLPDSLTSIGNSAFMMCPSLALTSLPENLTSIGPLAFEACCNVNITTIPSGCIVGARAFDGTQCENPTQA